jgi:hypothetical protein
MSNQAVKFENILNEMQGGEGKKRGNKKPAQNKILSSSNIVFTQLNSENVVLNNKMDNLITKINLIKENNPDTFEKNITFELLFDTLSVSIKEYNYQSQLFLEYTKLYDEMCNEENIVKVLDLLRMIISDRRTILNDIMSNVLKIQRLDNDRIKMDINNDDDDDIVDNLLTPDSLT